MARKWDQRRIRRFLEITEKENAVTVEMTPSMAQEILDHCNRGNRRINQAHMKALRRDMESGNWHKDVDRIGFDRDGTLVNGQHRLHALAGANVQSVTLKLDLDVEQHVSMDSGKNRTYGDHARIAKRVGSDPMPAKCKAILQAGFRLKDASLQLTVDEWNAIWVKVKAAMTQADDAGLFSLGSKANFLTVKSSLFAAMAAGVPIEMLSHVAEVLRTGVAKGDTDIPVVRLRDALIDTPGSGRANDIKRAAYTQHFVHAVTEGSVSNRLPSKPVMWYEDALTVELLMGDNDPFRDTQNL